MEQEIDTFCVDCLEDTKHILHEEMETFRVYFIDNVAVKVSLYKCTICGGTNNPMEVEQDNIERAYEAGKEILGLGGGN